MLVAVAAGLVVYDALAPAGLPRMRERRRRVRAERNAMGQGLIGIGMLAMAGALLGRDSWAYGTLAAIAGAVFLVAGAIMNRTYLKEALFHRGAARRRDKFDEPHDDPPTPPPTYRIR